MAMQQLSPASKRIDGLGQEQSWADLPPPLLAHILQHVPQQQRLTEGALVCKSWATAAAVATAHVQQRITSHNSEGFQSWLAAHAGQMASLQLESEASNNDSIKPLQLPWTQLSQLQCLHLTSIKLQTVAKHSATQEAGVQQGSASVNCTLAGPLLPRLKDLQLCHCDLASVEALVALVSQAPGLTRLVLNNPTREDSGPAGFSHIYRLSDAATRQRFAAAMCSLIQLLPQVTGLQLPKFPSGLPVTGNIHLGLHVQALKALDGKRIILANPN